MALMIKQDGWLSRFDDRVTVMPARPREIPGLGKVKPGGGPLSHRVMELYGGPRCVWVHGTDVVPRRMQAMAEHTAFHSKRWSGYHFLLGGGRVFQFYSVLENAWGAGRKLKRVRELATQGNEKARGMLTEDMTAFRTPVVDGRVVKNPNAWGPHIEIANWQRLQVVRPDGYALARKKDEGVWKTVGVVPPGKWTMAEGEPWHRFDPEDLANLEELFEALYAGPGTIRPDGVFPHSLVGVNRVDPGPLLPLEDIAAAAWNNALEIKDEDESNEGDEEDGYREPWTGPAQAD